jgi:hypothetical protein
MEFTLHSVLHADKPNVNGVIYPTEVLKKAIDEFNKKHPNGIVGVSELPARFTNEFAPSIEDSVFQIKELEFNEINKVVVGKVAFFSTPTSRAIEQLIKDGIMVIRPFGVAAYISKAVDLMSNTTVNQYEFCGFLPYRKQEVYRRGENCSTNPELASDTKKAD